MIVLRKDITAVILAGGKGQRLEGQDKGLVIYKNKPLIEHVLERITPQVDHILINANRNMQAYQHYGHPVFSDDIHGFQGPLAGFSAAMLAAKTDYILTLPCDGPLLPHDLLSRMLTGINATQQAPSPIAIAHDGIRPQRIYTLMPVNLRTRLNDFLNQGDRKVGLWLSQQQTVSVDFSDQPHAFANINTEAQRLSLEQDLS